jgi:hypothetical protein
MFLLRSCDAGWSRTMASRGNRPINLPPPYLRRVWLEPSRIADRAAGVPPGIPPDYLSHSHGEGFLRFFEERCQQQGIFIFDEPESAQSPARQIEFLKLMRRMEASQNCQIIIATHSPMLMAYPGATLLGLTKYGLEPMTVEQTGHYKIMREFYDDPARFAKAAIADEQASADARATEDMARGRV